MRIKTHLDDNLREVADDQQRLAEALAKSRRELEFLRERLEGEMSTLNATRLGRQLQRHGRYLRLAGEFASALKAKTEAIGIWKKYDRRRACFLCRLQHAVIRIEAGVPQKALVTLQRLDSEIDDKTKVYRDAVDEALGRCHFRLEKIDEALHHLKEALRVRRQRGNERHIERTRRMIEFVHQSRRPM